MERTAFLFDIYKIFLIFVFVYPYEMIQKGAIDNAKSHAYNADIPTWGMLSGRKEGEAVMDMKDKDMSCCEGKESGGRMTTRGIKLKSGRVSKMNRAEGQI